MVRATHSSALRAVLSIGCIEMLTRGLCTVATLKAVATYDGWKQEPAPEKEDVVAWFWEAFADATIQDQRALLSFITGSDRLPAMGAANLVIKLCCIGNEDGRYPVARTCFNMIGLHRYPSKAILEQKLWTAVTESEGFGLK